MRLTRCGLMLAVVLVVGGCPSSTSTGGDTTLPDWLNGDWVATATGSGESVSGCVTIAEGRVTTWGHGCSGENMAILDAPLATLIGSSVSVSVTVRNSSSLLMQVTMLLTRTDDDHLKGTITTVTLGQSPFVGTVSLLRR